MTLGDYLKTKRDAKKWTQPEAATQIGVEQSYLSKMENNKAIPSGVVFEQLMDAYGFSLSELSQYISEVEISKLKDNTAIQDFMLRNKQQQQTARQRWLICALISLSLGAALFTLGIGMRNYERTFYTYESKGVLNEGESIYLFSDIPELRRFNHEMSIASEKQLLMAHPLFNRIVHKQIRSEKYKGPVFKQSAEGGTRRYYMQSIQNEKFRLWYYGGISFGAMLFFGGLGAFYISKKW